MDTLFVITGVSLLVSIAALGKIYALGDQVDRLGIKIEAMEYRLSGRMPRHPCTDTLR